MVRPHWWFKNQDAKNARRSRWIYCDLENHIWVEKVSLLSKEVKKLEV